MTLAVDPSVAKPGLIAFAVVAALGLAAFFLFRSMNNQIKKISFDEREAPGNEPSSGGAGGRTGSAGRDEGENRRDESAGERPGTDDDGYR